MTFNQFQSLSTQFIQRWLLISIFSISIFLNPAHADDLDILATMDIEQLMNIEVTSVSKKSQSLASSPAAVFVVSQEDIRHSGASSIPEALRMVPGVSVAQVSASQWAISARGFNDLYSNKLLVMIDGRSIYNQNFSGIIWDIHDLLLDDILRIEVIRGPGGTLWGANAVNGVINIITKHSSETQGGLISLSAGSQDKGTLQGRYGIEMGQHSYARLSFKAASHDNFEHTVSDNAHDAWKNYLMNFRFDSELTNKDQLMVSAGISKSVADRLNQRPSIATLNITPHLDQPEEHGGHLLASWKHTLTPTSDFLLQAYYDHFKIESDHWNDQWDIFDLDFQHQLLWSSNHELIWGSGYRFSHANSSDSSTTFYVNHERKYSLFSAFIQDKIQLIDNTLWLTIGSKFEHNDYTGFEYQPSLHLLWSPDEKQKVWAAVSRAIRTPSRYEHELVSTAKILPPSSALNPGPLPVVSTFFGDPGFKSEDVIAWELGYRVLPNENLSLDIATYYNQYHHLQDNHIEPIVFQGTYIEQPITIDNRYSLNSYGIEISTTWRASSHWLNHIAYSFHGENYPYKREIERPNEHQLSIRSEVKINDNFDLNFWFRYVDETVTHNTAIEGFRIDIDDYVTLDATVRWHPNKNFQFSVTGKNLLESDHIEYSDAGYSLPFTKIPRSVVAQLRINF